MSEKSQTDYTRIGFDSIESAKAVRMEIGEYLHEKDDARKKDVYLSSETPSEIVEKARQVADPGSSGSGSSKGEDSTEETGTDPKKQEENTKSRFVPYDPTEEF
jgi:hypothetical protein